MYYQEFLTTDILQITEEQKIKIENTESKNSINLTNRKSMVLYFVNQISLPVANVFDLLMTPQREKQMYKFILKEEQGLDLSNNNNNKLLMYVRRIKGNTVS